MNAKQTFVVQWLGQNAEMEDVSEVSFPARRFDRAPALIPFRSMDYWFLPDPLVWECPGDIPTQILIPRGFVTDLASTPRLFWILFPPIGTYGVPAIMHDWLYWTQPVTRKVADSTFRLAMFEMGTAAWKRFVIYSSLRAFGWIAWRNNTAAKQRGERRVLGVFPSDPTVTWDSWRRIPGVLL